MSGTVVKTINNGEKTVKDFDQSFTIRDSIMVVGEMWQLVVCA